MKKVLILASLVSSLTLYAGSVDTNAVLGSMIGAGVGSAVGSAAGGKEGAIIGGGAGGAIGAAVGSNQTQKQSVAVVNRSRNCDDGRYHRDNGKHKGHHKCKKKHHH
jgi:outer membrane lipoprotein SlyB